MRRIIALATMLLLAAGPAAARHHHRHGRHGHWPFAFGAPQPADDSDQTSGMPPPRDAVGPPTRLYTDEQYGTRALVPADWQAQAADDDWEGRRFRSPDGRAWIDVYASRQGENESLAAHMKTVAFAHGEDITALEAGRDWIMVAGTKGDRAFYRRAVFDCAQKVWHHIAFEYPREMQAVYDKPLGDVARSLTPPSSAQSCERAQAAVTGR